MAWGEPPGEDAVNAAAAGIWRERWHVNMHVGSGAQIKGEDMLPGRSVGLRPGHGDDSPGEWTVYLGDDLSPGSANPLARAYWSTVDDGAEMASDGFALGWSWTPGANYQFQTS